MIDTLKLSQRLQAAQMPKTQADAVAEALNDSLNESAVATATTKQERELRVLRRCQIALFILIWGTVVVEFFLIISRIILK
jgi:hypothetical protein